MFKTKLTPNFALGEFIKPEEALLFRDHENRVIYELRLRSVAEALEAVRAELGNIPIHVTSGWRSPQRNKRVGGSDTSDHPRGYCADVWSPYLNADRLFAAFQSAKLRGVIKYDQLIRYPRHVHISVNPRMRGQAFDAKV